MGYAIYEVTETGEYDVWWFHDIGERSYVGHFNDYDSAWRYTSTTWGYSEEDKSARDKRREESIVSPGLERRSGGLAGFLGDVPGIKQTAILGQTIVTGKTSNEVGGLMADKDVKDQLKEGKRIYLLDGNYHLAFPDQIPGDATILDTPFERDILGLESMGDFSKYGILIVIFIIIILIVFIFGAVVA